MPTAANRLPAAASYLRRPGDSVFRAFKIDVLRVRGGQVAETTTFGSSLFGKYAKLHRVSTRRNNRTIPSAKSLQRGPAWFHSVIGAAFRSICRRRHR